MNKEKFYKKHDAKLIEILKALPDLTDLSTNYQQQAYILMIYAYFEGYIYDIVRDFYDVLKDYKNKKIPLNAHYNYCVLLYDYKKNKNITYANWTYFKKIKNLFFQNNNNHLIDTNNNLGYDIFQYILFILNINENQNISSKFYTKTVQELKHNVEKQYISFQPIINELLEKRNDIAHGNPKIFQKEFLTQSKIKEISDGVKIILRQLQTDLFEILENDSFLMN